MYEEVNTPKGIKMTREKLLELQAYHIRDSKIGNAVGCTRQNIHQLRKKFNIPKYPEPLKLRDEALVLAYQKREYPVLEIVRQFGLSISQFYRVINSHKEVKSEHV